MCNEISNLPIGVSGLTRRGGLINRLCSALQDSVERRAFCLDEERFCLRFGLNKAERQAIMDRDFLRLIDFGAHVAHLDQLAGLSGLNTLQAIERRTGVTASSLLGTPLS